MIKNAFVLGAYAFLFYMAVPFSHCKTGYLKGYMHRLGSYELFVKKQVGQAASQRASAWGYLYTYRLCVFKESKPQNPNIGPWPSEPSSCEAASQLDPASGMCCDPEPLQCQRHWNHPAKKKCEDLASIWLTGKIQKRNCTKILSEIRSVPDYYPHHSFDTLSF